jgi:hypothetical protein
MQYQPASVGIATMAADYFHSTFQSMEPSPCDITYREAQQKLPTSGLTDSLFLNLPGELRNHILSDLLVQDTPIDFFSLASARPRPHPSRRPAIGVVFEDPSRHESIWLALEPAISRCVAACGMKRCLFGTLRTPSSLI